MRMCAHGGPSLPAGGYSEYPVPGIRGSLYPVLPRLPRLKRPIPQFRLLLGALDQCATSLLSQRRRPHGEGGVPTVVIHGYCFQTPRWL